MAEDPSAELVVHSDDNTSFLSLFLEFISYADPAAFPRMQLLLSKWDELGFYLLAKEYRHLSPAATHTGLVSMVPDSRLLSAAHINHLVEAYTWDIFDRIFDYAVSLPVLRSQADISSVISMDLFSRSDSKGSIDIGVLMTCISFIADKVKAKELYIFAIEKLITIQNYSHSESVLQLQLFALQRALVTLSLEGDTDHLVSGLAIVIQQVSSIVDDLSNQLQRAKSSEEDKYKLFATWDAILLVVLTFYDGLHFKSCTWHERASEPLNSILNVNQSDKEARQGISMVAFLLQLSAKCVLPHPNHPWRMNTMKKISHRILSNFLSLDDVLVHPFRLRYRILRKKMKEIQRKENEAFAGKPSSRIVKRLRDEVDSQSDEVVDIGLFQTVPIHHRRLLIDLAKKYLSDSEKSSSIEKDRRYLHSAANVIAWKDVKDTDLSADTPSSANKSLEDQYFHPKLPWSMMGLTMFAQAMMEPSPSTAVPGESNLISSIYSARHIYDMFSIYLTPMLQSSSQLPEEGLSMANRLAQLSAITSSAMISYLPHSLHLQDASNSPADVKILEEILLGSASSEVKAVGIMSARSGDALQLLQSLINNIASCPDNQRRIEGYSALKSMLMMFEERSRIAVLRKLIDDCPFASLTGLLVDIVRDNCQRASRLSAEVLAPMRSSMSSTSRSDADRSMDVYQMPEKHSPFWSPLVLRLFVDKLFGSLSSMPMAELNLRIDEINATVALLQFIVLRIEAASLTCSSDQQAEHQSRATVDEILYPVLLQVQSARGWIAEKMKHLQVDEADAISIDSDMLRVQLLSANLDHLLSSMKRLLSHSKYEN